MYLVPFPCKCPIFFTQNHLSSPFATFPSVSSSSSSSLASSKSKSSSFVVDYLVDNCGLTLKAAIATSEKLYICDDNLQRHDSVLHLFRAHGFDNTHLSKLIQRFPILFRYKVDENLKPKLEYLIQNGFSGSELHDLIVNNPSILGRSLSDHIEPSLQFLRSFFGSEERLRLALKRSPRLLTINLRGRLQPNIELFVKEGVPVDAIAEFLIKQPWKMLVSGERILGGIETLKDEFGIALDPVASPNMFLNAVSTIASMGVSAWKTRVQLLETLLGCSQEEVLFIFRRYPTCFPLSEETLRSKVDFYFSTVQLKPEVILNNPTLLGTSLDKKIRPRYNVFKVLLSKKLLREDFQVSKLFGLSEGRFLDNYITPHLQQVPTLLEMYTNDKRNSKIDTSPQKSMFNSKKFSSPFLKGT